jgi:phosphate transport system protein
LHRASKARPKRARAPSGKRPGPLQQPRPLARSYDANLAALRRTLASLAARVEDQVAISVQAAIVGDAAPASEVRVANQEAGRLQAEADEASRRLLALRHPASDLRFLTTTLKVLANLERIGNLSVNIAARAADLRRSPSLEAPRHLRKLAALCLRQVRASLHAFAQADIGSAQDVIADGELIDALSHTVSGELIALIIEDEDNLRTGNGLLSVVRRLERLAGYAVDIAQMVITMTSGSLVSSSAVSALP